MVFNFPYFHHWHHIGCIQHTLPLLFDDCLTILEKLDALWCKLNDLITDYDEFKTDFETWKGEVESTLDSIIDELDKLDKRVSALEEDVATMKTDIANLKTDVTNLQTAVSNLQTAVTNLQTAVSGLQTTVGSLQTAVSGLQTTVGNLGTRVSNIESQLTTISTSITNLGNDITSLASRVTALENLLNNLNIVVPQELFKYNDIDWFINNVSTPWLTQMGLSTSTYQPLRKIIPVQTDVGTIPAVSFKVGVLGFPIVQAKIPLMYSFTPGNNINSASTFVQNIATDPTMLDFIRAVQNKSTTVDAFAPITLYTAPTFNPEDNIKFSGSYAIFEQPGSTSPTVGVELLTDNTARGIRTSDCTVSIRVALTKDSTSAYLAVAVDKICAYYCALDSKVYIMLLSEHQ